MSKSFLPFSESYFEARAKFREQAERLGWETLTKTIVAEGPQGEPLTIDITRSPDRGAENVLLLSSGLHGIEGYFGSGVQCALFHHLQEHTFEHPNTRIVAIHALNPFGFAWHRRADEDNIDLNRNFLLEGEQFAGCDPTYRKLNYWLNPKHAPVLWRPASITPIWTLFRHQLSEVTAAIAKGQYEFPKGIFFGGHKPAHLQSILRENLAVWLGDCGRVIHLDFHTGLGPWGTYKLLADEPITQDKMSWLDLIFGERQVATDSGSGISYHIRGGLGPWCDLHLGSIDYSYLCAEFGTYPSLKVVSALRKENQSFHWEESQSPLRRRAVELIRETFCPASNEWRTAVAEKAMQIIFRASESLKSQSLAKRL